MFCYKKKKNIKRTEIFKLKEATWRQFFIKFTLSDSEESKGLGDAFRVVSQLEEDALIKLIIVRHTLRGVLDWRDGRKK